MEPLFLTLEEVLEIHRDEIDRYEHLPSSESTISPVCRVPRAQRAAWSLLAILGAVALAHVTGTAAVVGRGYGGWSLLRGG